MAYLFSYGTLQQTNVQLELFGVELNGTRDVLTGYVVSEIVITDQEVIRKSGKNVHPILKFTGDRSDEVEGTVFELTDDHLRHADRYEVDEYQRVKAVLKSGKITWIYAQA